jgi:hypothetical protein
MKRFLVSWPVLLLVVFLASCGKEASVEEDVSQYFIKCKIGSVDKTFKFALTAHKEETSSTGETSYSVSGKIKDDANDLEGIGFTLRSIIPVETGIVYKETDPTLDYALGCIYNPNTKDPDKMFATNLDEGNPFQIKLTELTNTTISGTFSGRLYLFNSTDPKADSAVISNGQFKLKLQ